MTEPDWIREKGELSTIFRVLVEDVESQILASGHDLIHGHAYTVARNIVMRLACVYKLSPSHHASTVDSER